MTELEKQLLDVARSILADDMQPLLPAEYVAKVRSAIAAAEAAATSAQPAPNYPAVPEGWTLVKSPITEDMHRAAVKVLVRANGVDGLPQRMLDAMVATAPAQVEQQAPVPTHKDPDLALYATQALGYIASINGVASESDLGLLSYPIALGLVSSLSPYMTDAGRKHNEQTAEGLRWLCNEGRLIEQQRAATRRLIVEAKGGEA
ncbi:hypothetical protein [Chromobacterium rhizoryzae]|uniref:Uncharacterized protein n=1 Tax=Chromobacterium rhizoryzae TaxID=1778675 RepID=A0AAD0RRE3_9NEIS|nr:hypothetical protein [Chromobacterium rhizoryzae]AXT46413.1 hypothetical protein D1345_09530 [Chromobacterium rhizoryzae]